MLTKDDIQSLLNRDDGYYITKQVNTHELSTLLAILNQRITDLENELLFTRQHLHCDS